MPNVVGNRRLVFTGSYLDPDAASYIARAGISDATEISAVNTFVKSCKSVPAIWASMQGGICYLISPTSFGASLYNLMSSSYTLTIGVSPSFSTGGLTFNGATQYLTTGFNPLSVMTANQGFILVDCSAFTQGNTFPIGASDAGGTTQWHCSIHGSTNLAAFNAYNSATAMSVSNSNFAGTYVFSITASNARYILRNGASLGTSSAAVGGTLPNLELYVGARNLAGAASGFANITMRTVINGLGALSSSDAATLTGFVNTYNANVISGGR